ncbi:MAG: TrkH family potassium uptake protein [Bacteroidia bacterium]|nr:MAG: TrkH family potassium uptake protein [Bacteroidia bacterium]
MKQINLSGVSNILSKVLLIESVFLVACIPVALIFAEPAAPFTYSSIICSASAFVLFLSSDRTRFYKLGIRDAFLSVTLSWVAISLFGVFPYVLSGSIPGFTNALFESTSGFTTTGSSILTDIEILPKSILFWRSLSHWIGGIGIVLLVIILLPSIHAGVYRIFTLESSVRVKTHPRLRSMGIRILWIYVLLTFLEVVFLLIGKVTLYESVCHSFGTIATGGFSNRNSSVADFSPYVQYVIMIFMLLAGMNFILHYYALKGNLKKVFKDEELRFYLIVILLVGLVVALVLHFRLMLPFEKAFRDAYFQVISLVTSTGFITSDYLKWPQFTWIIMFLLLFAGGSTGSTSGGIKMARHLLVLKNVKIMFRRYFDTHSISLIKLNGEVVPVHKNISIITFVLIYLTIFIISTALLTLLGVDPQSSAGSVATVMGGIGPGIGTVGPVNNFAHLPEAGKLLLIFLMVLGRLEIFTVLAIFMPGFWRV